VSTTRAAARAKNESGETWKNAADPARPESILPYHGAIGINLVMP